MTALICVVCHRAITREMHRVSAPVPGRPDVLVEYHVGCWEAGHRTHWEEQWAARGGAAPVSLREEGEEKNG
jgi:hypothetical protein